LPAVANLLHYIEEHRAGAGGLGRDQALPPYKEFKSSCVAHVKEVVQSVDRAYSDMQLQPVLEQECEFDEKFSSMESGFDKQEACKKFAKHLTDARMKELETGSQEGYEQFCDKYYVHRGGTIPAEKPKEPKEPKKPEEKKAPTKAAEAGTEDKKAPKKAAGADKEEKKAPTKAAKVEKPQEAHEPKVDTKGNATGNATAAKPEVDSKDTHRVAPSQSPKAKGEEHAAKKGEEEHAAKKEDTEAKKEERKLGKFPAVPVAIVVGGIVTFILSGLLVKSRKRA